MLGTPSDVEQTYLGEDGLLAHLAPDSVAVDHTTSSPDLARRIYQASAAKQIAFLDVPVLGGDSVAREGKLIGMVGGDAPALEKVRQYLSCYCKDIQHIGGPGEGLASKLTCQIALANHFLAISESLFFAQRQGLSLEKMLHILLSGAASSFMFQVYGPRVVKRNFEPGITVAMFLKDLNLVLDDCRRMGITLPGVQKIEELYTVMKTNSEGDLAAHGLIRALEHLNPS
jgi:3-hydroxyisobutyrate dehydrogenase